MSAAAVIALRRKKLIRRFAEEGAISCDKAIPFAKTGVRRSWVFDQMVARGVFVPVGDDRYYLDEQSSQAFLARQRRRALVVGGILLLVLLVVLLATRGR